MSRCPFPGNELRACRVGRSLRGPSGGSPELESGFFTLISVWVGLCSALCSHLTANRGLCFLRKEKDHQETLEGEQQGERPGTQYQRHAQPSSLSPHWVTTQMSALHRNLGTVGPC